MCHKCEEAQAQAKTTADASAKPRIRADALVALVAQNAMAQHFAGASKPQANQNTILFEGNDVVAIKPFATLDDVVTTGEKVARLVYPISLGEERQCQKFEADLVRAAATLPALPLDQKFEGLVSVLAIALMGVEPEDLGTLKVLLKRKLEQTTKAEIRNNTTNYLVEKGFATI